MSRFFYLQGLQRENVWIFGKDLKKMQGAIHVYVVPLPDFSNSNEL